MADKQKRPCARPGCRNLVEIPKRICPTCQRRARRAARAGHGRVFSWGASRVLGRSVLTASGPISVNADFYRDRQPRGPNGECPFCGLTSCSCASEAEIRLARPFMEARDD